MAKMTPLLIRLEPELIARIDVARGDVARAVWVRRACEQALELFRFEPRIYFAGAPEPINFTEPDDAADFSPAVQYGPAKAKPGSRLKGKK